MSHHAGGRPPSIPAHLPRYISSESPYSRPTEVTLQANHSCRTVCLLKIRHLTTGTTHQRRLQNQAAMLNTLPQKSVFANQPCQSFYPAADRLPSRTRPSSWTCFYKLKLGPSNCLRLFPAMMPCVRASHTKGINRSSSHLHSLEAAAQGHDSE